MTRRSLGLSIVIVVIVLSIAYLQRDRIMAPMGGSQRIDVAPDVSVADKEGRYPRAQELVGIAGYVNSDGITLSEYIGERVILIDFWTYSCINCQRTFPYLKAWWNEYEDDGLLIVGVHTPEFDFERDIANVREATEKYGITYPVVLDNDYATWRSYRNQYWPRKYLIDVDGYIVYDHIGEGGYQETEEAIVAALTELRARRGQGTDIGSGIGVPEGVQDVDRSGVRSPEVYFGAFRNGGMFGNGVAGQEGTQSLAFLEAMSPNRFYLDGTWRIEREFAENVTTSARVQFRYQAKSVNIVAGADLPVRITVLRDGEPIGDAAGDDVVDGGVTVEAETLYNVINDPDGYGEHTLELLIEGPGLQLFTFTFG